MAPLARGKHINVTACAAGAVLALAALAPRAACQPIDALYSAAPPVWSGSGYAWGSNATALRTPVTGTNPITGSAVARSGAWRTGDGFVSYAPGFPTGVASGDPLPGQVILWTRFQHPLDAVSAKAAADPTNTGYVYGATRAPGTLPVAVSWWLGMTSSGIAPLAAGTYTTDGSRDWTVKVDVQYSANTTGTRMYYGFTAAANGTTYTSPVGSFRAMASGQAQQLDYAVVSCSNWGFGLFNAYDMLAQVRAIMPAAVLFCASFTRCVPLRRAAGHAGRVRARGRHHLRMCAFFAC